MRRLLFLNVLLIGVVSSQQVRAQVKSQTPPQDDIVRVSAALVQTDVTVRTSAATLTRFVSSAGRRQRSQNQPHRQCDDVD